MTRRSAHRIELCIDCDDSELLATFWRAALGWRQRRTRWGTPELVSPDGTTLWFQQVPESKTAKNRLHLDLYTYDLAGMTLWLESLGASRVNSVVPEEINFQVMRDPEGNEFCVCLEHRPK